MILPRVRADERRDRPILAMYCAGQSGTKEKQLPAFGQLLWMFFLRRGLETAFGRVSFVVGLGHAASCGTTRLASRFGIAASSCRAHFCTTGAGFFLGRAGLLGIAASRYRAHFRTTGAGSFLGRARLLGTRIGSRFDRATAHCGFLGCAGFFAVLASLLRGGHTGFGADFFYDVALGFTRSLCFVLCKRRCRQHHAAHEQAAEHNHFRELFHFREICDDVILIKNSLASPKIRTDS